MVASIPCMTRVAATITPGSIWVTTSGNSRIMPVELITTPPRNRPQYSNFSAKSNLPTFGIGSRIR